MEVKLFLAYLPLLRQPAYSLKLKGLADGVYASWELQDTTPIKRSVPLVLPDAPQQLQDLFCENDLGKIRFLGGTSFWAEPKKLLEGWGFADMSEANIVVSPSGEVDAYNAHPIKALHGDSHFLGALAKDLESFLEGMLYAQLNKTHFISGFPDEDPVLNEKTVLVAKHCSLIAGGYKYYDFWAGILGLPYVESETPLSMR